jgi:hypothetical protein
MAKGYSSQQKSPRKSPWNQGVHAGFEKLTEVWGERTGLLAYLKEVGIKSSEAITFLLATKPDLNLSAKNVKIFLCKP